MLLGSDNQPPPRLAADTTGIFMLIRIGYDVVFDLPALTPMLLMLNVHPSRAGTLQEPERIVVEPASPITTYTDAFGNTCGRVLAEAGQVRFRNDAVVYDTGELDEVDPTARQHLIEELPPEALQYLLSSR